MKKTALILAAVLAASRPALAKVKVVTTLQDLASIANSGGGDRVETFSLARGYQDPHFVDAKPSFVLKLSKADLLVVAGLELEIGYLPPLVDQSRNEKVRPGAAGYLDASKGCDILQRPT
jgi:zinc/manganese transport system substrate-binding protein